MKNTMNNVSSRAQLGAYAAACEVTKCISSKDAVTSRASSAAPGEKY